MNAQTPRPSSSAQAALPLAGLRVLDLSTVVAGPYGAEILGELGADVIRVEPPDKAAVAPTPSGAPITEADGFTWALQRNKRAMCIDLKHAEGRALFMDLVKKSDVVWDNFRPGVMARLGLSHAELAAVNPGIISCSISGFGSEGPWSKVGAYDITVQALAGSMSITGTGEPGSIPCRWGVPVGDIAGSIYAVIGVLAALHERARTAVGQHVEVALLDAQLALNVYRVPQAFGAGLEFSASSPRKGGAGTVPYGPFCAQDGEWLTLAVSSNFWKSFCEVIEHPELLTDARFVTLKDRQSNQPALDVLLEQIIATRTAAEWEKRLLAAKVPSGRILSIADAFRHPQAEARGMCVELVDGDGRMVPVAGSPLRFAGEAARAQRAPVQSGRDTKAILQELLAIPGARIDALASQGVIGLPQGPAAAGARQGSGEKAAPASPLRHESSRADTSASRIAALAALPGGSLAGTLVLELCGDEPSGTLGTQILADLGATVIKLERLPASGASQTVTGSTVTESVAYFWGLNRNKLSLSIDLKRDEGRALFHSLVAMADVVYDNYRPDVAKRVGADAETLRKLNPRIVLCSVSGFGRSGPLSDQPAYDVTVQALGGGMSLTGTGEPGSPPVRWGNPIGGIAGALYAVSGILAALARRRHSGLGASLDIALLDAQLTMNAYRVPPALANGVKYGPTPHRGGSGALPYGPFLARCGHWFVLGITSQFWAKACDVLDRPQWVADPRFASESARQKNEEELNAAVGDAIARRDASEWQERCIAAGIPGATVYTVREAFGHPHVALRNMLVGFEHPLGAGLKVAGDPIKMSAHAFHGFAPAPGLGTHTRVVLEQLLGIDKARMNSLRDAGIVWWPDSGEVYARPSVV
jgi:crotonobetainyl-CoA:carnitine CoA-transferase CaiB-like acyl-CoA transferase